MNEFRTGNAGGITTAYISVCITGSSWNIYKTETDGRINCIYV